MSIQAEVAFEGEFKRKPTKEDCFWLAGYEKSRTDNGSVMTLMEQEIYAWRNGQRQSEVHRKEAEKLKSRIVELEAGRESAFAKVKREMQG